MACITCRSCIPIYVSRRSVSGSGHTVDRKRHIKAALIAAIDTSSLGQCNKRMQLRPCLDDARKVCSDMQRDHPIVDGSDHADLSTLTGVYTVHAAIDRRASTGGLQTLSKVGAAVPKRAYPAVSLAPNLRSFVTIITYASPPPRETYARGLNESLKSTIAGHDTRHVILVCVLKTGYCKQAGLQSSYIAYFCWCERSRLVHRF